MTHARLVVGVDGCPAGWVAAARRATITAIACLILVVPARAAEIFENIGLAGFHYDHFRTEVPARFPATTGRGWSVWVNPLEIAREVR